jgi:hypothetical protein
MNLPWFLGVAMAQMSLGLARKYCQESHPKEVVPEQAEVLVILGESEAWTCRLVVLCLQVGP